MTTLETLYADLASLGAERQRIAFVLSELETKTAEYHRLMNDFGAQAAAANAAALLDGGSQEAAKELHEKGRLAFADAQLALDTAKQVLKRRDEVDSRITAQNLAIAREVESLAFPEWNRLSADAHKHYVNFLEAVRSRLLLAATCTRYFEKAGVRKEPFDENSRPRMRFSCEFGCGDNGLLDLAARLGLVQTSDPLELRLSREAELLPVEALVELSRKAAE